MRFQVDLVLEGVGNGVAMPRHGGYLALNGQVTVGVVIAFLTDVQQFFRPIQALSTFYTTAQASLERAKKGYSESVADFDKQEYEEAERKVRAADGDGQ